MELSMESVKLLLRTLDLKIVCNSNVRGCSEVLKAWGTTSRFLSITLANSVSLFSPFSLRVRSVQVGFFTAQA